MPERCVLCGFQSDEAYGSLENHLRFSHQPKEWYPAVVAMISLSLRSGQGINGATSQEAALSRAGHLADEWVIEARTQPAEVKVRILGRAAALRKALKVGRRRA